METDTLKPSNITGTQLVPFYLKLFWRALLLLSDPVNRQIRKQNSLSPGDALFNFVKLSFLEQAVLKYRFPVSFGSQMVLDSTFPPYPSRALDKRLSNYLNHLDLTKVPSGIVSISTTNCCPYNCSFCSTSAHSRPEDDLDEELIKQTIRQVEELGTAFIILHGGEPMLRYDRFLRLVKSVGDETCLWMFTTGYAVTPERARELKENGLFGVWVSLDHYDAEVHNRLRGHPRAFENACLAVENFRKAGVYTCLSLVPPPDLEAPEKFRKYYDFAHELGVAEIRLMEVKPSGREACQGVKPHSPVLARLQQELHKDPAYRKHPPISGLSTWLEKDPALGCQCRFEYVFITSTGEVQPCEATEISFGNITQEPFLEIYDRICREFPRPSTGCIPMVMYEDVRRFQADKASMTSVEKGRRSAQIMAGFREKGELPGAYKPLWSIYERRLKRRRTRRSMGRPYSDFQKQ